MKLLGWRGSGDTGSCGADVLDVRARPVVMIRVPTLTDQHRQDHACVLIMACRLHPPPPACRRRAPDPVSLRESLEGLLTDPRKPRGKRHPLPSPVSVMVAGVASGRGGAQAVAQAASWD